MQQAVNTDWCSSSTSPATTSCTLNFGGEIFTTVSQICFKWLLRAQIQSADATVCEKKKSYLHHNKLKGGPWESVTLPAKPQPSISLPQYSSTVQTVVSVLFLACPDKIINGTLGSGYSAQNQWMRHSALFPLTLFPSLPPQIHTACCTSFFPGRGECRSALWRLWRHSWAPAPFLSTTHTHRNLIILTRFWIMLVH